MDCGIFTSKTILLFLSLVFWAAGAVLAYIGAYVIRSYNNFDSFIQDKYALVPAAIIIGISIVMFLFGLIGCCSTLRESKFGLSFFFLIIMAIFAAEVAALVFSFIYQGKISGDLERSMNESFAKYDGQGTETKGVDYLQSQLGSLIEGVWRYAMLVILGFAIIKFFGMLSVCVINCQTGSRRSGYQPFYA
ncbi:putative tetraspanin-3-like [Scophthalmus maximus]|uniref:Putative tetraspanin-3-like n=1 Tax=Scophthalmus maximus TaxID=52904 RepID=A0A2U9BUG5_SCOMX|nr:putative tetraspanin-3-like [Scophthalmus maximus]